jgi:glycosyltransferase involved in cell wall biosynthesis
MTRKLVVLELQADPIGSLESIIEYNWAPWVTIPAAKWVYPRLDAVVCVSEGLRERAALMGVDQESIRVIPNGVDVARVRELAAAPPPAWMPDEDYVVGLGRLVRQKGFDLLIEAHARVLADGASHKLVIVGEGQDRAALEALAVRHGVADSVLLPGFLENPFPVLARASLFCLPSRYEGFGLVLAEALALGLPVVATDCVSGPSDVLDGGRLGQLVEVESVDALAAAIGAHFKSPDTLGSKANLAAREGRHSISDAARRYADLFDHLLSAPPRAAA